jgi:hypothetical protein
MFSEMISEDWDSDSSAVMIFIITATGTYADDSVVDSNNVIGFHTVFLSMAVK